MGLFSDFVKTEVNEFIGFCKCGAAGRLFEVDSPQAAPFSTFSAYLGNNISLLKRAGSGADDRDMPSEGGAGGTCAFGGICRKILEGEEVLLSGTQGLSERKRVALRAALPLNNSSAS